MVSVNHCARGLIVRHTSAGPGHRGDDPRPGGVDTIVFNELFVRQNDRHDTRIVAVEAGREYHAVKQERCEAVFLGKKGLPQSILCYQCSSTDCVSQSRTSRSSIFAVIRGLFGLFVRQGYSLCCDEVTRDHAIAVENNWSLNCSYLSQLMWVSGDTAGATAHNGSGGVANRGVAT